MRYTCLYVSYRTILVVYIIFWGGPFQSQRRSIKSGPVMAMQRHEAHCINACCEYIMGGKGPGCWYKQIWKNLTAVG
jgi:hypothetical protein